MLQYQDVSLFLDEAIDVINDTLNSTFPVFSEVQPLRNSYVDADGALYFPDCYIRSVVIPYTAYKFYVVDEEGSPTAPVHYSAYKEGLFKMTRDFLDQVPTAYRKADTVGSRVVDTDFMYSTDFTENEEEIETTS